MSDEAEMVGKMGVADLERYLRQYLELRKYLVVVDDLWHREAWESLKRALPDCQNGSRVIITTRKEEIAARADRRSFPHKLRFRTPEESWNLFCNKASPAGAWSPAMANLGREMVGKCSGLPLAITVLGGLLSYQRGLEKWQEVRAHIWDRLKEDSVEIHELLSLSYHDLSPNLKSCFLYLGIFPKDHVFNAEKLILLWMAEELIPPPLGGKRMEDVAEDYLEELINRSLVLPAQRFWGKIVGCRLHNLLRDLTVNKAMEVKLFQIYDREINFKQSRPGRLIIQDHVKENFPRVFDSNTQLRSLVFTKANPRHRVKPESIELVCEKFKLLRVLDFEGVNLSTKDVPDQMRKLSRLKFLGLTETSLTRLPPAIGNLRMLQTLEAMGELTGIRLPKEVSKMKKLRHIRAHIDGPLHPLETMENLQTLRYVRYDQWVNFDPSKLTSLQELEIRSIARSSKISSAYSIQSISKLQNLRSLMLSSSLTDDLPPLEPLSSCPRLVRLWLHGKIERLRGLPESITTLTLMGSQLSEDPMPILEKLPNLTSLELKNAHNHERMVCASDGFRQLEFLELAGLRRLQEWIVKDGAMPRIKGLVIFDCNRLERLPAKLKSVSIRQVPEQNYLVSDYRYETSWAYDWEKPENIP